MQTELKSDVKVSIITVVLNGEEHVEQAIQSVLSQTYPNIEYFIIDGKSTDGTTDIIRKYEHKLTKWISEADNGMYGAINKGISFSTGELIGILNSDDWYEPDAVERVVQAYREQPGANVYHGMLARLHPSGRLASVSGISHDDLGSGMIDHPSCFVTRETYLLHGAYDTGLKSAADYEFMLRIWKKGARFYFIKNILTNFRLGGQSASFSATRETLAVRKRYGLISWPKKMLLVTYWGLKSIL